MRKMLSVFLIYLFTCFSCIQKVEEKKIEVWKNEIIKTELDFSNMAQKEGMDKAFLHYVANDGVLLRNDKLIKGKDNIRSYMKSNTSKGLSWKPDFVDVSASGDLGYTYGKYSYRYQDSLGNSKINEGVFHTVWKRQTNGVWRFVWD